MITQLLGRLTRGSYEHHRWVLAGIAALTVVAGLATLAFAKIDSDLSRLISPSQDLAWFQDDQDYKALFPDLLQTAIVVVDGDDAARVDRYAADLRDALDATNAFDFVFAPSLDPFVRDRRAYFLDVEQLADWAEGVRYDFGPLLRLADSAGLANFALTVADQASATPGQPLQSPLRSILEDLEHRQPSSAAPVRVATYPHLDPGGRHYVLIIAKGEQRHDQELPNAEIMATIDRAVSGVPAEPGITVRVTGDVALAHEELSAGLSGIALAGALSVTFLAIVLGYGLRSARVAAAIFVMLATGVVLTLGFATLVVGTFNTLALVFVVMFFGLGVDFAVHFVLNALDHAGQPGETTIPTAMQHAGFDVGPALLLCMVTSGIAFLSFWPTDYRGLAELGIISGGGMAIAFGLTLTMIPALFRALGVAPVRDYRATLPRLVRLMDRPRTIVATALAVAVVATLVAKDLRFDYNVIAMRDKEAEATATLLELQREGIVTDYSITVLVPPDEVAGTKRRLELLDVVASVEVPTDLVPSDQETKHETLTELATLLDTIDHIEPANLDDLYTDALVYLDETRSTSNERAHDVLDRARRVLGAFETEPTTRAVINASILESASDDLDSLKRMVAATPFALEDVPDELSRRMIAGDGRHRLTVHPANPLTTRADTDAFVTTVRANAPNAAGRAVIEWGVGDVAVSAFIEAATIASGLILAFLLVYFRNLALALIVFAPLLLTVRGIGPPVRQRYAALRPGERFTLVSDHGTGRQRPSRR